MFSKSDSRTSNLNSPEFVLSEVRKQYETLVRFYKDNLSNFVPITVKKFSRIQAFIYSSLLNLVVILVQAFSIRKPPKYIFVGLTHVEIMRVLAPSEVMVIGGRNELNLCRKKAYRFHWAGYIYKSFELFLFANMEFPLVNCILFIQKYFLPRKGMNTYLFLWEDHRSIGLLMSLALGNVRGINVVSIAHGYEYALKNKTKFIDGSNCKFNFVYDKKQVDLIGTILNKKTVYELGLPYEVKPINNIKPKVVLVEHTGSAAGAEYIISVYHFIEIYRILTEGGLNVIYRARPRADYSDIPALFSEVYGGDKLDLFAEGRMIFIGFSSTLLYEAKVHGNIVIGLDTSELFDQRNFDVDATVYPEEYKQLPLILLKLMSKQLAQPICNVDSLSSRFFKCVESIDNFNTNHG